MAGLGAFVELKTVLPTPGKPLASAKIQAAATAEHGEVIALLELDGLPPLSGSYCDLLAEKGRWEYEPPGAG